MTFLSVLRSSRECINNYLLFLVGWWRYSLSIYMEGGDNGPISYKVEVTWVHVITDEIKREDRIIGHY